MSYVVPACLIISATINCNNAALGEVVPSDFAGPTASEESFRAATWDLVFAAASQPPSASSNVNASALEALFHLLDKTLLLKHLRELKAEKTVNGKPCYKSYVRWEDLNQTQRTRLFPSGLLI
jgi:hypothetical protein